MGKFDGILICSDWDGTLFDGKCVPEKSVEAIKYFQQNGGEFTICSGRPPFYMKTKMDFVKPNTYAIALNGLVICDLETEETVFESFSDDDAYPVALGVINSGVPISKVAACVKGKDGYIWMSPDEFKERISELKGYPVYKITFTAERESDGDILALRAEKLNTDKYKLMRSARGYLELIPSECTKGKAALRLKKLLGARLLVCMGDYENDIPMFECADVSYATANAIQRVKDMATHVTSHVSDAAVASVISDIEKNYLQS